MRFRIAYFAALALFCATTSAPAATILDTTSGNAFGSSSDRRGISTGQSLALPFSAPTATTITSIVAYIGSSGANSLDIGIMADSGGLPSGSFLFDQVVSANLLNPVNLSSLNLSIAAMTTYWLVANAVSGTAFWEFNDALSGGWAIKNGMTGNQWFPQSGPLPEAIISDNSSVVPLPAALPLFATGLGALGLLSWRRKRKAAGLATVKKLLVAVTTCAAILVSAGPVYAVSFDFSFTNQFPLGDVNGTVTGRIDGLANTGASAATGVFITSSPLQLGYPLSASDNFLSQPSISIVSNSFTVTSGVLTAMDFRAQFPIANAIPAENFLLTLILNPGSEFIANRFGEFTDTKVVSLSATFSQVPLPAALPLFATGLGALGLLGWRRKRKALH